VSQYLVDDLLILDTGYYLGLPAAFRTSRNINVAYKDVGQEREQERKL
jgi:hypothetical protein